MTAFLIIAGLILLNGIFVAAEFAIVGAPRAAIDARAARGDIGWRSRCRRSCATRSGRIATSPPRSSASPSPASASGMYGEHVLADGIYHAARPAPARRPGSLSHGLASVVAIAILTYFHIVVGEMIPKSLALQQAERMALWITPPMLWIKTHRAAARRRAERHRQRRPASCSASTAGAEPPSSTTRPRSCS